jgi:hypothetical protein
MKPIICAEWAPGGEFYNPYVTVWLSKARLYVLDLRGDDDKPNRQVKRRRRQRRRYGGRVA